MSELISEIKRLAMPFQSSSDLQPLIDSVKDKKVVMLGEASHGTHEFYEWRAEITQILIEQHGFDFVAVEGDWPACEKLNQFVKNKGGKDAFQALSSFTRWPTWMWANHEVVRFAEWLRSRSLNVGFHGLDVYSLFESIEEVVKQLQKIDPVLAAQAREQYSCFDPFLKNELAYARSLLSFPEGCRKEVLEILAATLKKTIDHSMSTDPILFDVVQNARIVADAENYYRTMIEADGESWNVRDSHMAETLEILLKYYGTQSKGIIWAHNTHVGDYRATDMLDQGQINIGGLAREKYGNAKVALVGFGTHRGMVVASSAWDGPVQTLRVPEANFESIEAKLHQASMDMTSPQFLMLFDEASKTGALSEVKGHRAIGVVYRPGREHMGNYVPTSLSHRYDAFIFIDETHALQPIGVPFDSDKIPENWPLNF
jgi:erythromycin esterase